jgi:tRNA G18 (ribose-2'-O)-methylase SpoU
MTARIDSPSNPRIAAAVKAIASGEMMLLEGRRMIEEALEAGVRVDEVFLHRSPEQENQGNEEEDFLRRVKGESGSRATTSSTRVTEVAARVLRKLSDLPSTRGAVAIAAPPHRTLASLSALLPSKRSSLSDLSPSKESLSSSSLLFLLLDDVQDPANVGAILRSGEAFGAAGAVLTAGCAWPFSPRALRTSAGSVLRLPVAVRVAAAEAVAWVRRHGIALAGAAAHGGTAPDALGGVRPLALVIGSEGHGISAEIAGSLDHRVTLPLAGRVDSLNAAVAAGVLLHILTRRPAPAR